MVNDTLVIQPGPDEAPRSDASLHELVGEWLTLDDVSRRFGLSLNQVRRLLADRDIVALRLGGGPEVPARFFDETGPLPSLRGTLTVLIDGGMNDREAVEWLFTPDETLPTPGTPVENLHAGFKTEIRRRAMELAF